MEKEHEGVKTANMVIISLKHRTLFPQPSVIITKQIGADLPFCHLTDVFDIYFSWTFIISNHIYSNLLPSQTYFPEFFSIPCTTLFLQFYSTHTKHICIVICWFLIYPNVYDIISIPPCEHNINGFFFYSITEVLAYSINAII